MKGWIIMPASHGNRGFGTCTQCGKEDVPLTFVNDEDHVCDACLDDWTQCDICGEYFMGIDFVETDDGRLICEYCAEDLESDEMDEDDE